MKISEFTVPELRVLVQECNFTKDEIVLFNLRARDISLETCAEMMNLSVSSAKESVSTLYGKLKELQE